MGVYVGGRARQVRRELGGTGHAPVRVEKGPAHSQEKRPAFDVAVQPHEYVGCAICGTTPTQTIATKDRYGLATKIVQCVKCGLRYINPRMTKAGYAAFYRHGYRQMVDQLWEENATVKDERMPLEMDQAVYAMNLAATVASWMPTKGSLIDVGGSTGVVARHFGKVFGLSATVIDPSPDELARAMGCQTIQGSAEDAEFPKADVALLCRTIDHLLDPVGVLRRLREAAKLLVVDVMDVDAWMPSVRYKVDHPYAFTKATFEKLVTHAGWHPVQGWTRRGGLYVGMVCRQE